MFNHKFRDSKVLIAIGIYLIVCILGGLADSISGQAAKIRFGSVSKRDLLGYALLLVFMFATAIM